MGDTHTMKRIALIGIVAVASVSVGTLLATYSSPAQSESREHTPRNASSTEHRGKNEENHQNRRSRDAVWSQQSVVTEVLPGQPTTNVVTLTVRDELDSAVVWITPSLAPYVTVSPTTTGRLKRGQVQQFTITATAPIDSLPTTTQGVIQLREVEKREKRSKHDSELIAQPLPVTVNVVWSARSLSTGIVGIELNAPPSWFFAYTDEDRIRISNSNVAPNEDTFLTQAYLAVNRKIARPGASNPTVANPKLLPVDLWFNDYFASGFHTSPESITLVTVGGREAVRLEIIEVGGRWVHFYIPVGPDIIEIAYQLELQQFLPVYELITNTAIFTR
jgi:hypothetical protein